MASVAIVHHPLRQAAAGRAAESARWLVERGHEVRVPEADATGTHLSEHGWPLDKLVGGLDLAVSLGGDGTMLRTVDLVAGAGVPVLGVNVGHMGYLTAVEPDGLEAALERFFGGDFSIEARLTLLVEVSGAEGRSSWTALNEVVLEKTVPGNTVRLALALGGERFTTCAADGLIVSTPTGSTAYNLSARGPIVSPQQRALVVTPVAPHMLFDRSLVLSAEEWVSVEVMDGPAAAMVVDGRSLAVLGPGDAAECRAGPHDALFVTFDDGRDFHQILKAKFGLADR
ncbi:MAG: NAD(+)/NADH kinase [Actinomycetota bacterium]|nr:NAD(+)/NADH kinase [Actinomycetota bacterium]MDQ3679123.1 NAD(+)/NADH kinase [Actinomycetota bacterium]